MVMKNITRHILSYILIITLMANYSEVKAQTATYKIYGTITDSLTKEPLPGVYVTTGKLGAQSDYNGNYVIENVPMGEVKVSTMYYYTYSNKSTTINVNSDTKLDFILEEKAIKLNEIVVTGTRTEKRLSETPILTNVISKTSIVQSGSTSTLETLQDNIPGMFTSPNAMGNNLKIRGLNSRYILFLVDGERLISEGAGGNVNLDQIDPSTIERIEVINGSSSALYGSNAVGAIINIITKEPVHKFEGGAEASYSNYNTQTARANIGINQKRYSISANGFRNSSDGFNIEDGAYAAKYQDYGANLKLTLKPNENLNLNFTGRYFQHETFNMENTMATTHPINHSLSGGFNGSYKFPNQKNVLNGSINYNRYLDYNVLELQDNELMTDNIIDYLSARVVDTWNPNERFEVVGGIEYNYESTYATKTLGSTPTTKSVNDMNVFAQAEYELTDNFDAVAGLRYTHHSEYGAAVTPKIALMYEIGNFKFRGGVGSAYRSPSIKELYYDFDHQGMFWVYGNPDLRPEKGLHSSLSMEYIKGFFNFSLSPYYNNINNKITQFSVIQDGQQSLYYKNVSSATLKGFDANISFKVLKQVIINGNYSFCDAIDNSTGLQLEENVKHSGTISLTWNGKIHRSPFSLQFAGRLTSPKLYGTIETDDNGNELTIYEESKSYNIWKIALVKPFRINKHTIELTLKADNIFGFTDESYISPGRQYLVGIKYMFK